MSPALVEKDRLLLPSKVAVMTLIEIPKQPIAAYAGSELGRATFTLELTEARSVTTVTVIKS